MLDTGFAPWSYAAGRRVALIDDTPDPVMRRMRAYLRFDRRESRLPAAIAILVSAGLYFLLPAQLSLGPGVIFPIVAVLGVLPLTIADALGREQPWQRPLALTLLAFTVAANGTSLALLVHELIAKSSEMSGRQLLRTGAPIWLTNMSCSRSGTGSSTAAARRRASRRRHVPTSCSRR